VLSGVTYNGDDNVTGWRWGNGVVVERTYDLFGRLTSYPLGNVTRTVSYDDAGRITGFTQSDNSNNQAFGYDGNDRLTQQTSPTFSFGYGYDATGNRTSYRVGNVTLVNAVSPVSNQLTSVQRLVGAQVVSYAQSYDAAGALVADGGQTSIYSDRGRRASTTSGAATAYRYNGFDERVGKSGAAVPSGAAYYAYDPAGRPVGEYDAGLNVVSETVYLGSTPVAVLKQVGPRSGQTVQLSVNNVYADQVDTPRVVTTNTNGAVLWRWDVAEAFGNSAPQENPSGLGTFTYNQRMPGQTYDAESGLVYNIHRDYRPSTGSYVQSDPIGLNGGIDPFAYAYGAPLQWADPSGELPILPIAIAVATLVGSQSKAFQAAAADAAEYWADRHVQTGNWVYGIPGALATLADPCNAGVTSAVLSFGSMAGAYVGRPFWQYYPVDTPLYSSSWMTRGWGWGPPFQTGQQAAQRLALPPYNPATAVRSIIPSPFRYVAGPRSVQPRPEWGQPGGGVEFRLGGFP
jgi:RHS repeat-associated protein